MTRPIISSLLKRGYLDVDTSECWLTQIALVSNLNNLQTLVMYVWVSLFFETDVQFTYIQFRSGRANAWSNSTRLAGIAPQIYTPDAGAQFSIQFAKSSGPSKYLPTLNTVSISTITFCWTWFSTSYSSLTGAMNLDFFFWWTWFRPPI